MMKQLFALNKQMCLEYGEVTALQCFSVLGEMVRILPHWKCPLGRVLDVAGVHHLCEIIKK